MIDLIHSILDAFRRCDSLRDVTCNSHAETMRLRRDGFDYVGCQVGIKLDLFKPSGVIAVYNGTPLLGCLGRNRTEGIDAAPVYQTCEQHARTRGIAFGRCIPLCNQEVKLTATITRARDAGRQ